MDRSSPNIVTELADLSEASFQDLRRYPIGPLEPFLARILSSIERPRINLGGGGPPGRVD